MSNTTVDNIIQLDFSEEMRTSYRNYAMSVIIARALPDVRDGLKPVQRRILYAMTELGLDPKKPHRKSARIVGDTMGKYHPHGDSSIYDALVHMTEDYSLPIPLVDGHGNFGSLDGDPAAAMRYTEARLSAGAMALLENLDKNLVEFIPNFDDSEKEPVVLPSMLPNLLINGTTGIAVGMATNIPPHNPGEVIDGVIAYMDRPSITIPELMQYIPGPDFPTGGTIINSNDLLAMYENGEGKIKIRSKVEIEASDAGRKNIVITEIPYTCAGNKTKLVENLVSLMKDKVFEEIYDVRDESSKEGVRIVVEVKRDRDTTNLLNGLYKKSAMEDTYGVNLLAVKDNQPIQFNLKGLIQEFVAFQEELYTKQYEHLLAKALARQEIVNGLVRATDLIDLIIEILRGSTSVAQAKACMTTGNTTGITFKSKQSEKLAATLDFTERQADAILAMQLSKLIGLEILKLHEENQNLAKQIEEYRTILGSKKELYKVIKSQLRDYKKQFNRPRCTEIAHLQTSDYVEEVRIEDLYVLVDRFGYTKCVDTATFSRTPEESLREFTHIIRVKNTDKLCLFTAEGNMYQIKVSAIPRCKLREKGTLIQNLCKVDKENILLYLAFEELFESQLLFISKSGFIKLVSGIEFETNRSVVASTKLDEGDAIAAIVPLSAAQILGSELKVILLTQDGLSLGFLLSEVPELKKTGRGVKGIQLEKKDTVAFATVVSPDAEVFEYDKKAYSAKKVRCRKRGAKGQKATL
ncbi:MAG: DNA topoisomerase 4 subunit A [Lachnospiraceae bacterium]|nr:DNA topoisomerase 4 subunit A [Lachnospiraceae bacterium]